MPRPRFALFTAALLAFALPAAAEQPAHLRLVDRLDRPQDGYCFDVIGSGGAFRPDLPLVAHNCKPARAPDGVLVHQPNGALRFPAFDACVTAMGVGRSLLPGAALMLRPCGGRESFLLSGLFQSFTLRADGRLIVDGFDLCVVVGPESAPTFSPSHAWRPLTLARCDAAPSSRAVWEFIAPYGA